MRRGPTGLTSETSDSGPGGAVSLGGLARRYVGAFVFLAPAYLLWRTTTVGTGWMLALSMPWLWAEVWLFTQILALRHEVTGSRGRATGRTPAAPIDTGRDLEVVIVVPPTATVTDVERTVVGLQAATPPGRVTIVTTEDRRSELVDVSRHWHALAFELVTTDGRWPSRAAERFDMILANTELPWVLWIEAGQVPMPELTDELNRRPFDERTAVCQIAVGLLNAQSLVHVNRVGDDEALEQQQIGPALARRGSAPWHGPGSVIRRAAFAARPPVDDPTVSALSRYSVELKRDGWRFDYDPRPLIRVPAADSLRPYLMQRRCRSLSSLEELGLSWSLPGVGWTVRQAALARAISTTYGLRQLAVLSILLACLLVGRLPVVAENSAVLVAMAAFSAASFLARRALSGGTMAFGDWVKHAWRTLPADIAALTPRLAKPLRLVHPRLRIAHRGSLGRMQLLTLTFVVFDTALAVRALDTVHPLFLPAMSHRDLAVLLLVSIGMSAGLFTVLGGLARDLGRRRSPRVAFEADVTVAGSRGSTLDITPDGLAALVPSAPPVGSTSSVQFSITGHRGVERSVDATGTIRTATLHESGAVRVGIEFDDIDVEDRMAITEYCALGLSDSVADEAKTDHLITEASFGQLAMVRGLAGLSLIAAAGAVMLGPQADAVAAESATTIPPVFTPVGGADGLGTAAGMQVRLHTDAWSEPLAINGDGAFDRGSVPEEWDGPVMLEIALGDDRHVGPVPVDGTIRLVGVEVAESVTATIVGPGGRWRSVGTGDALVPGPYTVRWSVDDGEPELATVVLAGDEILSIRADGVAVVPSAPAVVDPVEVPGDDPTDTSTTSTTAVSSTTPSTTSPPPTSPPATSSSSAPTSAPAATATSGTVGSTVDDPVVTEADDSAVTNGPAATGDDG